MALKQSEVKKILFCLVVSMFLVVTFILYSCTKCLEGSADCQKNHHQSNKLVADGVGNGGEVGGGGSAPGHKLCLIVPFRDRFEELLEFAPHMKSFLGHQGVSHEVWVIHQEDKYRFNRAALINVGFKESSKSCDFIAMHDVDLLPQNPKLEYKFPESSPTHLAAPGLHPKYDYETFIGGIFLISRKHFKLVDGMSNKYWGWGLEDDELFVRLRQANLNIERPGRIGTGKSNTFKHLHNNRERKRDNAKCYNQRNLTRRRDRQTGLSTLEYKVSSRRKLEIDGAVVMFLDVVLICDKQLTPWCNCTGAPLETEERDLTRDEDVVVPIIKRQKKIKR